MMKAEIASEIIRSRIQTPIPVPRRAGRARAGSMVLGVDATPPGAAGGAVTPVGSGSENVGGMFPHCIQKLRGRQPGVLEHSQLEHANLNMAFVRTQLSAYFRASSGRVTMFEREGILYDAPFIPE